MFEFVPGTSRVCPWDASGASDRQIPLFDFSLSGFSLQIEVSNGKKHQCPEKIFLNFRSVFCR